MSMPMRKGRRLRMVLALGLLGLLAGGWWITGISREALPSEIGLPDRGDRAVLDDDGEQLREPLAGASVRRANALPEVAATPAPQVLVRSSETGSSISGARVWTLDQVADPPRSELLGSTGADGHLSFGPDPAVTLIRVVAGGYAEGMASVAPDTDLVIVELAPGWRIRGRVAWPWGEPAADVDVVAWGSSRPFDAHLMESHIRVGPTGGRDSTRTDALGNFELEGMVPGEAYSVAAGSDGALTTQAAIGVTPAQVPVDLTLDPLFGVIVKLVECGDTGSPVNPDFDQIVGCARVNGPGLESVSWNHQRPYLSLSGIEGLFSAVFQEPDRHLMLFKGVEKLSGVATARVFADVWGYDRALFDVPVADLRETGQIPVETRCISPSASGWGTLRLSFTGPLVGEGPSGCVEYKPAGHLRVQPSDGGRARRIPVRAPLSRGLDIPGVPAGPHEAWFEMGGFKSKFPADRTRIPVFIREGETHELSLDVSGVGTLDVEVRTPDGDLYTGVIALRLKRLFRKGTYFKRFTCAPYRFPGLEPGDYRIELEQVALVPLEESRDPAATATVPADVASRVVFQL